MNALGKMVFGLALVWGSAFALPAYAHKVVISVYADGDVVEGEIGFSNGDIAKQAVVEVFDEQGKLIGQAKTDDEGIFHYKPTKAIPLTFKANLGAGHIANYQMAVDELPDIAGAGKTEQATQEVAVTLAVTEQSEVGEKDAGAVGIDPAALQKLIAVEVHKQLEQFKPEMAKALRKETKPLHKAVFAYMEKNDLQSILGGIGYICGLFGVGFYVAARRERSKALAKAGDNAGENA